MNFIATPFKKLYALMALLFMMFSFVNVNAQTAFEEDVDDEEFAEEPGPAPVDTYIYAGVLAAGLIGYAATRHSKTAA
jgi:hypothetical protein